MLGGLFLTWSRIFPRQAKYELTLSAANVVKTNVAKQSAAPQEIYSYRIPWLRRWSSLFLNEFISLHDCRWKLLPRPNQVIVENLVLFSCTCLHLSFSLLLLVCDGLSITENSFVSTFVKPLSSLKHSIKDFTTTKRHFISLFNYSNVCLHGGY